MKLNIAVTAIALATLASTTTEAQAQTTLYGCYVKNSGTVYRIKAPNTPTKCSGNATEFSWNMEGQIGPQGPQGPQGPAGPATLPAAGIATTTLTVLPGATADLTPKCILPGQRLITGGYHFDGDAPTQFVVQANEPHYSAAGPEYGWHVKMKNTSAAEFVLVITVYCTNPIN